MIITTYGKQASNNKPGWLAEGTATPSQLEQVRAEFIAMRKINGETKCVSLHSDGMVEVELFNVVPAFVDEAADIKNASGFVRWALKAQPRLSKNEVIEWGVVEGVCEKKLRNVYKSSNWNR